MRGILWVVVNVSVKKMEGMASGDGGIDYIY